MRERPNVSVVRDEVRIFVEVHMSWAPHGFEYAYAVDRDDFRDSLTPLRVPPRDDDFYTYRLREEQRERRRRQAEQIAAHIANAIIHAAEKQDPK